MRRPGTAAAPAIAVRGFTRCEGAGGWGSVLRFAAAALAFAAAVACASGGPWDVAALAARYPAFAAVPQNQLADMNPYLLPAASQLSFFTCRWPTDEPIPVSLPPEATPEELAGIGAVMRAWEGAGLGIRFETGAAAGEGIEVRLIDPAADDTDTVWAGTTIADCALEPEGFAAASTAAVVPARLVSASIHTWRSGFDNLGRPDPHSEDEFLGSLLHEFGHALGFQGHVHVGASVMVREKDVIRRAGRNLAKGWAFQDHTLRALYALPSGTVLERVTVRAYQTQSVDRMQRFAREHGLSGPLLRVGDFDGFLAWHGGEDERYVMQIRDVRKVLRSPETLWVESDLEIEAMLGQD